MCQTLHEKIDKSTTIKKNKVTVVWSPEKNEPRKTCVENTRFTRNMEKSYVLAETEGWINPADIHQKGIFVKKLQEWAIILRNGKWSHGTSPAQDDIEAVWCWTEA